MPEQVRLKITPSEQVTAMIYPAAAVESAGVCLILAHGAGANQTSSFMVRFATALAERGIDTVTFNFIYSEERRRIPDRNDKLELCYRKIIAAFHDGSLQKDLGRQKLVIGGKSMGGRIASQVAATVADDVAGLVLLGYPLHPPGRPEKLCSKHLRGVRAPMLFVQGSRDSFGTPDELRPIIKDPKTTADLCVIEGGDHSFKVPKQAAMTQEQVHEFVLDEIQRWLHANIKP
jgi:predicted alpha/beta-hydrolase family hydrolase